MSEPAFHVAAFYRFVPLVRLDELQRELLQQARSQQLVGTILLAEEGINGTLASRHRGALEAYFSALAGYDGLAELPVKWSTAPREPFERLLVKRKREIVPLGQPQIDPQKGVGQYVPPAEWNALIADPELILIDARNDYEVRIGAFAGAVDPKTRDFRELPDWLERNMHALRSKKVAMYCTGGIRCEKATAYLLERGLSEVYHLQGGILAYLEQVPEAESQFRGSCFVFDQRVSLNHGLETGHHRLCARCGAPHSIEEDCEACRASAASDVLHQDHAE